MCKKKKGKKEKFNIKIECGSDFLKVRTIFETIFPLLEIINEKFFDETVKTDRNPFMVHKRPKPNNNICVYGIR